MGKGGDAALAAPAGKRQGERCLDSQGPTQRSRLPDGECFEQQTQAWLGCRECGQGWSNGGWGGGLVVGMVLSRAGPGNASVTCLSGALPRARGQAR